MIHSWRRASVRNTAPDARSTSGTDDDPATLGQAEIARRLAYVPQALTSPFP